MKNKKDTLSQRRSQLSPAKQALLKKRLRRKPKKESTSIIQRRPHQEKAPLSFAQQRLWYLNQLEPGNPFYNEFLAVRLSGALNITFLNKSWNELVIRHESLRTTFPIQAGTPIQVIAPPTPVSLPIVSLEHLANHDEQEAEWHRQAIEEARIPFDLAHGPLFRLSLFRFNLHEHVFVMFMHHIVVDGWSLYGVLMRELVMLYEGYNLGVSQRLPSLSIQYADFAYWQRNWLQGEVLDKQLNYWKKQLADLPVLQLPVDQSRPTIRTFKGAKYLFTLSATLSQKLKSLSQREQVTPFMLLLAAFKVLLHRYSGLQDIVVGSPIANRTRPELEGIIGFFANTLVFRTPIAENDTFRQVLKKVKDVVLQAHQNQDLPFDKLVEELHPERNLNQNPLFQVMFLFHDILPTTTSPSGLTVSHVEFDHGIAKFDLTLFMRDDGSQLSGLWEYETDIFDESTIARLGRHFQNLLKGVVTNPDQSIATLPLMSGAEKQQLLAEWNNNNSKSVDDHQLFVHELFESQAQRTPAAVAVSLAEQTLTYQELNERANQLAHNLRSIGVGPDVIVAICIENSLEMMVGLLGILKAGGAYVPLEPTYPQERLAFMLADTQARVLLTQQHLLAVLPEHSAQVICLDTDWETIAQQDKTHLESGVVADNLAYVIYTSGSTGKPKGTLITHRGLANYLAWCQQAYPTQVGDGAPVHSSIAFDLPITGLFMPLTVGHTVHLASEEIESERLSYLLRSSKQMSLVKITPAHLDLLSQQLSPEEAANQTHAFIIGGENLLFEQLAFWRKLAPHTTLINEYGPTETVVGCCVYTVPDEPGQSGSVPIGRPIINTQLYILSKQLQPVPIGVTGELYIGGRGLAHGYLNRPALTAANFIPNPFSQQPGTRLYKTGDLARYRPDGNIEFLGRIDDQVKIRGFRIELGEIEAVLTQHPAVQETALLAREGRSGNKELVGYIVSKQQGADITNDERVLAESEHVSQWQALYEDTYGQPPAHQDPTFNTIGWNSSYTGLPLPEEQMHEWVANTVDRILSYQPRRVLEIGCGTGLLLFRIAPHSQLYWGSDLSQAALHYVQQQSNQIEWPADLKLLHCPADNFDEVKRETFDTIIINSVIQYLPSINYLWRVLKGAVEIVEPGGRIFVGDVRSLPLLRAFHTSVQLHRASSTLPVADLVKRISQYVAEEAELVVEPAFFMALQDALPKVSRVEVKLKRGHHQNELTKFRYDVVLHIGEENRPNPELAWLDWQQESLTLAKLRQILHENEPTLLYIKNIPNARITADMKAVELLTEHKDKTVGEIRPLLQRLNDKGIDPEDIWTLSQEFSYHIDITLSDSKTTAGSYNAIFRHQSLPVDVTWHSAPPAAQISIKAWPNYANNPLHKQTLPINDIRRFLQKKLPDYMIPATFVQLDSMPLTANGKVNRRALPAPNWTRPDLEEPYVAPRNNIEKNLSGIWSEVLNIDRVGVHDNFFDLGGHSLLATQLVFSVREALQANITIRYFLEAPTIAGLATLITTTDQNGQSHDPLSITELDLEAEAVLDPTIVPSVTNHIPITNPKSVLLTGATGFLGAFLLYELLQQTDADIYCLVRAKSSEQGKKRLLNALESYSLRAKNIEERIIPVLGDLSKPLLGIPQKQFQALARNLDVIHHNGAFVNFVYSYEQLKAANVLGTQEILRLASQEKLKPVHFVSTISVFPGLGNGRLVHEQDEPSHEGLEGGYARSKWVAEKLIRIAESRGVPVSIYRPATITGDSQSGAWNTYDSLSRMIRGCIELGSAPDTNTMVNMTPVDYVSQAIIHISLQKESLGKAFHLVNPDYIHMRTLCNEIRAFGYPLEIESYNNWRVKLGQVTSENPLYSLLTVFPEEVPEEEITNDANEAVTPQFDSTNTLAALKGTSICYPPVDNKLIATYMRYFMSQGFLPKPKFILN